MDLEGDKSAKELAGDVGKYFDYYHEAYSAALGGMLGSFAIEKDGQWIASYVSFSKSSYSNSALLSVAIGVYEPPF